MADSLHTQELINRMMIRIGTTADTEGRADALVALNEAQLSLWGAIPWWFKFEETTFPFISGSSEYTLNSDDADVSRISDVNGKPLTKESFDNYAHLFTPDQATAGTPIFWTLLERNIEGALLKVRVWPTPTATENGTYRREKRVTVLTDSDESFSSFPEESRYVIELFALELLMLKSNKPNAAQLYRQEKEQALISLGGKDRTQKEAL